ncbi:MAG TPA: methyl-accepting chemotaxis protein [Bacillota bacterium]|nr:methyl-accepting chemotaxis protein [Bacillota bacterium]
MLNTTNLGKLSFKLTGGFLIVALIALIIGSIGLVSFNQIITFGKANMNQNSIILQAVDQSRFAQVHFKIQVQEWKNLLLRGDDPAEFAKYKKSFLAESAETQQVLKDLKISVSKLGLATEKVDDTLEAQQELEQKYTEAIAGLDRVSRQNIDVIDAKVKGIDRKPTQYFDEIVAETTQYAKKTLKDGEQQFNTTARNAQTMIWAGIVVGLLLAVWLGLFISAWIVRRINHVEYIAEQIATGDLEVNIDKRFQSNDEIGNLITAFERMIENIQGQARVAQLVAEGDLTVNVQVASQKDILAKSMGQMVDSLRNLTDEIERMNQAASEGKLHVRCNTAQFLGGYQQITSGINRTMDLTIQPIKEATDVLQKMAMGNLQEYMIGNYQGDHALLKEALNKTIDSFNEVLGDINSSAGQVASGSEQVSQASQSLSQGAAEQASTMEQINASVAEIAGQTKQNAINASQANELALKAKDNAIKGNEQMQAMLNAMVEINESSSNISKIIKVIDEIAFQTNILALNAAVEAARAGQYGKGFAVVAEEVRNLAARSASAAKETTAMIEGSIKKVETGGRIADETALALKQIVEGINQTVDLVGEIAIASNGQATGIAQINQGIAQISQVTQGNTATAEQSAAASEELTGQAKLLKEMVRRFKISEGRAGLRELSMNTGRFHALKGDVTPLENKTYKPNISLDDRDFAKY